jgi:uncharacterized membrane protein
MSVHRPNFLATLARIVVLTVLATALSFAVTLLVSIISLALISAARHTTVDMSVAYRVIGVRAVIIAAPLALLIIGTVEMRSYLRARNEARPLKFVNE